MYDERKTIAEVRTVAALGKILPMLEAEGWQNFEMSITPYGTILLRGWQGFKPRAKKIAKTV